MERYTGRLLGFGLAISCAIAFGTEASAYQIRHESGLGPRHEANAGYRHVQEQLPKRTDGKLTFRQYNGSLLGLGEISPGIRDGITDMGLVVSPYWPAEYNYHNFLAEISGISDSGVAMTGANTEFVLLHCEPCRKEFQAQNQVALGMWSNPPYVPIARADRMDTPESLRGKRFRAGSVYFRNWAEHFGGVAVSVPGTEIYEGLSGGMLDATLSTPTEIPNFGLTDVAKTVTRLPIGTYHSMALYNVNADFWRDLPVEHRQVLLDLSAEGTAVTVAVLDAQYAEIFEKIPGWGMELVEPTESLLAAQQAFLDTHLERLGVVAKERYGIPNGPELVAQFRELAEKWNTLVEGIDRFDWEQVADLYKREIYSKIDVNTFGL
ncbi:MAG: C4-dicarboxylate TRAP transporter substrate-binding protein [Alphaproteobacteria bacterium]